MMKMMTAYTMEPDELDIALAEILAQIDLKAIKGQSALGLLTCHSDFIGSGIVKALCQKLPFDVIGSTTLAAATGETLSVEGLSLSVLYGPDVFFATGLSEPLDEKQAGQIDSAYKKAAASLPEQAKMVFSFQPIFRHISGDIISDAMNAATDNLPNFGMVTVDHEADYHTAQTIYNGEAYTNRLAFALVAGDIEPAFFVASIPAKNVRKQKAVITASKGNLLEKVNDVPILEYMQSMGLSKGGKVEGVNAIPFIIDYNDGTTPVARAIFDFTPEGFAVCGGVMPEGATLSVGTLSYQDVLDTAADLVQKAKATGKTGGMLLYSCIMRNLSLAFSTTAEMETLQSNIGDLPIQFSYAGGEISPVYGADGKPVNRFHNDTIIACIF